MNATAIDYRALAEFRYQIRRFLAFSQQNAKESGLDPQQHQLLLAVKGRPEGAVPTIGYLAERLQLRHHSASELVGRLVRRRLVARTKAAADERQTVVCITAAGERILDTLTRTHRAELRTAGPLLARSLRTVVRSRA